MQSLTLSPPGIAETSSTKLSLPACFVIMLISKYLFHPKMAYKYEKTAKRIEQYLLLYSS
jgi:hypothetical protein